MVGDNVSGVGGTCFGLSAALAITVCKLEIEWVTASNSGAESVLNYQPTLTISGGDITAVTMTTNIEVAITGTATLGTDFNPSTSPVTLVLPKGDYSSATTLNFNDLTTDDISIIEDILQEADETIILTLQNAVGMDIGDVDMADGIESIHTYTIIDNDVLLVEWLTSTDSDQEATGGNLPSLVLSGAEINSAATIEVALSGTATAGTDYLPATTITVTIPVGDYQTSASTMALNAFTLSTADLSITDDQVIEGNETIILTLQNPSGVTIGDADGVDGIESFYTYIILDDDALSVEFTNTTGSALEADGDNLPQLAIQGAIITSSVTVEANLISGGTAISGTDFEIAAGTYPVLLTIPAGDYTTLSNLNFNSLTATQDLSITDDVLVEAGETFTLELQNGSGVNIADADGADGIEIQFLYTILDDDCAAAARVLSK